MLVLSRRLNETIQIGTSLVSVLSIRPGSVKLGIEASGDVEILRGELIDPSADAIEMADLAEVWQKNGGQKNGLEKSDRQTHDAPADLGILRPRRRFQQGFSR